MYNYDYWCLFYRVSLFFKGSSLNHLIKERIEKLQPIPRKVLKILVPESVSDVGLMVIEANNFTAEEIPNEFLELCRVCITLKLYD